MIEHLTHKDPRVRKVVREVLTFYKKKKYHEAWEYVSKERKNRSKLYLNKSIYDSSYDNALEEIEKNIREKIQDYFDGIMKTYIIISTTIVGTMILAIVIRAALIGDLTWVS